MKIKIFALSALLAVGVGTGTALSINEPPLAIAAYADGDEPALTTEESPAISEEATSEQQATSEQPAASSETPATPTEKQGWEMFVEKYLGPEKVALYMSWLAYIGTMIGLVANIKRLKQTNNLTLKSVSDELRKALAETVGEEVAKKFDAIVPSLMKGNEELKEVLAIFAKILALVQEDSPESRVAILDLIQQLGSVGKETIETAKKAVDDSVKAAEAAKEEIERKTDEIIEAYDGTSI